MRYDPGLKAVLLNNSSTYKLWTLKFDRKTVKVTEIIRKEGKGRKMKTRRKMKTPTDSHYCVTVICAIIILENPRLCRGTGRV